MALWILNRPSENANIHELRVAERLAQLNDDWVIRWGFYYHDNKHVSREGDFLILGPHGGLLVLEVKAGSLDFFPTTGRWETEGGDHPMFQLDMEWKAVVLEVNAHRNGRPSLYVAKGIGLPDLDLAPGLTSYHDIPREFLVTKKELKDFPKAWANLFGDPGIMMDGRSREVFFESYAKDATPKSIRYFVTSTDRTLMRQTEANYELLDQLGENSQFMVRGGAGSGKTWMAFELACRWAIQGKKVLLLGYNLALTDYLKELTDAAIRRQRVPVDGIVVRSWEELAKGLVEGAGLEYDLPSDAAVRTRFYTFDLPDLMMQIARGSLYQPDFDALVVDEGQDHDTEVEGFQADWNGPGWWGIYWRLLKQGPESPVAVFYDPAQRPLFRKMESFAEESLYKSLGKVPVRLRLSKTVRYTRPVFEYLKTLQTEATAELLEGLNRRSPLSEGPAVEEIQINSEKMLEAADKMAQRWIRAGLCQPEDILVISQHGRKEKSCLKDRDSLAGHPIVDYLDRKPGCIRLSSANRAKGLDSLAVILIDFERFSAISEPMIQVAYFLGASRARQLLGVIYRVDKEG